MMESSKGITPLVATILLLLIVISVIGFVFGLLQRVAQTAADSGDAQLRDISRRSLTLMRIDNAKGTDVTVRNIGSVPINSSTLAVYVNNVPGTCEGGWSSADIAPGGTATCTLNIACSSGDFIRITSPGPEAAYACS